MVTGTHRIVSPIVETANRTIVETLVIFCHNRIDRRDGRRDGRGDGRGDRRRHGSHDGLKQEQARLLFLIRLCPPNVDLGYTDNTQ